MVCACVRVCMRACAVFVCVCVCARARMRRLLRLADAGTSSAGCAEQTTPGDAQAAARASSLEVTDSPLCVEVLLVHSVGVCGCVGA